MSGLLCHSNDLIGSPDCTHRMVPSKHRKGVQIDSRSTPKASEAIEPCHGATSQFSKLSKHRRKLTRWCVLPFNFNNKHVTWYRTAWATVARYWPATLLESLYELLERWHSPSSSVRWLQIGLANDSLATSDWPFDAHCPPNKKFWF